MLGSILGHLIFGRTSTAEENRIARQRTNFALWHSRISKAVEKEKLIEATGIDGIPFHKRVLINLVEHAIPHLLPITGASLLLRDISNLRNIAAGIFGALFAAIAISILHYFTEGEEEKRKSTARFKTLGLTTMIFEGVLTSIRVLPLFFGIGALFWFISSF